MAQTPAPVRGDLLTEEQLLGRACIWCAESIGPGTRRHVGYYGNPAWKLYGCLACALTKRLPTWPETGSA